MESAIALCNALGIEFSMHPLDCDPFLHGYGMECSESKVTIGIWYLPLTDLNGTRIKIPFYIVQGNGVILLGHSITSRSNLMNEENLLVIPPRVGNLSEERIVLPVYSSGERNYLLAVPAQISAFSAYFRSTRSLYSTKLQFDKAKFSEGKYCKWFASKLHAFTHYTLSDMVAICKDGQVLTPNLRQALKVAFEKCHSCKTTGRPKIQRKVSFDKLVKEVNEHVQVDYFFIKELSDNPILHARDKASGFSATRFVTSRDMEIASKQFRRMWIEIHGPPQTVSGDPEFCNSTFKKGLLEHGIQFDARPARRHNKIGAVESRHNSLRLICLRLLKDAQYYRAARGITIPPADLLSKATFLANTLRGNSKLSSFELARGYQPAIIGLPQTIVSKELVDAYREQMSIRAICKLLESRSPKIIKPEILPRRTQVFYFVKEPSKNRGQWKHGYVFKAQDHFVEITANARGAGAKSMIAYEDIRLVPSSSLLLELSQLELELNRVPNTAQNRQREMLIPTSPGHTDAPESTLWASHPVSRTFLSVTPDKTEFNEANFDIGSETPIEETHKDIGDRPLPLPTHLPIQLESCEQTILQKIKSIYGYDPVTKAKLQFVPSWVLEKAEAKEKANYMESIEIVDRRNIPRPANIISSHFFFKLKEGDEPGHLALKCRCVPHGNRDKVKEELRSDSSTAQFPVIRSLLSLAAYHKYTVAKVDISGAFLQGGTLDRDVYVRPPTSWMTHRSELWKLVRPAYGLVESGRTWQLTCEKWMQETYKLKEVPGFAQMFVLQVPSQAPSIFMAKVVDDFLLAGTPNEISRFHTSISKRFKVGTFCPCAPFTFNALLIEQNESMDIRISMNEFMQDIKPLDLSRRRRKSPMDKATAEDLTNYLSLTGSLNYLGHGVLPIAAFSASYLQQRVGNLLVSDLKEANSVLSEIHQLKPIIEYKSPASSYEAKFLAFSDGAQGKGSYGQTGYVSGIFFQNRDPNSALIYHITDWYSGKQTRVSFSSIGCEILAAATSCDRAISMVRSIQLLHESPTRIPLVLTLDSLGLFGTITTLHDGKDYRLRPTVTRLRDSYEAGEISVLQWVPGKQNISDALTKRTPHMFHILNRICISGTIPKNIFSSAKRVLP